MFFEKILGLDLWLPKRCIFDRKWIIIVRYIVATSTYSDIALNNHVYQASNCPTTRLDKAKITQKYISAIDILRGKNDQKI